MFIALVELLPDTSIKTSALGVFLFLINNIGGNLPVLVDPLSKAIGYRQALYLFFPAMVAMSKCRLYGIALMKVNFLTIVSFQVALSSYSPVFHYTNQ